MTEFHSARVFVKSLSRCSRADLRTCWFTYIQPPWYNWVIRFCQSWLASVYFLSLRSGNRTASLPHSNTRSTANRCCGEPTLAVNPLHLIQRTVLHLSCRAGNFPSWKYISQNINSVNMEYSNPYSCSGVSHYFDMTPVSGVFLFRVISFIDQGMSERSLPTHLHFLRRFNGSYHIWHIIRECRV